MRRTVFIIFVVYLIVIGSVLPACDRKSSFEISDLIITPREAVPGQDVKISASVRNAGEKQSIYTATLLVNEEEAGTESISLGPEESGTVNFLLTKDQLGIYNIELEDLKGILEVVEPARFEVSSLTVFPDVIGVEQEAIATAVIRNTGRGMGTYSASLEIAGNEIETRDIDIPGSTESKVKFTVTMDQPGVYKLMVGDATAELTAKQGFYNNAYSGFNMTFPESWKCEETGDKSNPVKLIDTSGSLLLTLVNISYLERPMSPQEVYNDRADSLDEGASGVQILSNNETHIADSTPAYEFMFKFEKSGVKLVCKDVIIVRGTQVLEFLVTTTEGNLSMFGDVIDEFIEGIHVHEPQPFGIPRSESVILYDRGPETLDPAVSGSVESANYIVEIFSGLVAYNQNIELVPDIADKWDISKDGTIYTFYLRKDVKFHSGREVTADDFKYSMERACHPDTGSKTAETYLGDITGAEEMLSGQAEHIRGIKVIDDHTLEITIDNPSPSFLVKLAHTTSFVVDRYNVTSGDEWWRSPNGTGPFKLGEWQEDELLILERNDLFYSEKPGVGFVVYRLWGGIPIRMYETGEIDVARVDIANIDKVRDPSNPLNAELTIIPEFSVAYIGFDHSKPPFDDVNVRKAFCHAVDKEELIKIVFRNIVRQADGIIPPGFPGYNESIEGLSYDPQKAKRFIAESTYGNVSNLPRITLTTSGRGAINPFISTLVDMWRQNLGVEVQVKQLEPETYYDLLKEEKGELFTFGWSADYLDPEDFLDTLFYSGKADNIGEYSNSELDELLERASIEHDESARIGMYQEIEQMLINDAACLPTYHDIRYMLTKPYLENWVDAPLTISSLKYVSIKPH